MDQQALLLQESPRIRAGIEMGRIDQGIPIRAASLFPDRRWPVRPAMTSFVTPDLNSFVTPDLTGGLETVVGIRDQQVFDRNGHVRELLEKRKPHIPDAHVAIHLGRQDLDDRVP